MTENDFAPMEPVLTGPINSGKTPAGIAEPLKLETSTNLWLFLIGFLGLNIFSVIVSILLKSTIKFNPFYLNPGFLYTVEATGVINGVTYAALFMMILLPIASHIPSILQQFKNPRIWVQGLGYAAVIVLLSGIYQALLNVIGVSVVDNANQSAISEMVRTTPVSSFLWIVMLGPIVEELTYRLGLFDWLKKGHRILAYVGTMFFFGLIHFDFSNPNIVNELLNLPAYVIGGAVLCYSYDKSGLATSTAAHIFNNLLSFVLIILAGILI